MFSSIRTRLTLSHLAVIVVAMSLSGFLLLSLLERYFLEAMEDSLYAQARITAQALIPGAMVEDPALEVPVSAFNTLQQQRVGDLAIQAENVAPPLEEMPLGDLDLDYLADASLQLSAQLDTRIRILDARGAVLVDSNQEEPEEVLAHDPLVAQALAGQYASGTVRDAWDEEAMHLALPVLVEDQLVGVVYLSQPLRDATAVLGDLRLRWLLSTAVALILSGAVGLLLSGAITRPLRRLTAAAGAVARGEFDQQVPAGALDELGRLSRAFNDMTARLRAARQTQVDFVANVSHELRTPLTAIKGTVETLRAGAVDDREVRDRFLETVEDETDRLIRLVNDLLILSRADSEALHLQREPVDVGQLAQNTAAKLAAQAGASDLVLQVKASPGMPLARADPDRIEQVLVNLLDNAIKYSRHGGTVSIHVDCGRALDTFDGGALSSGPPQPDRSRAESMARVQVIDQGIGVPAVDLPRIGERFYRADRARSRAEGGSGLGLAIAQALVEAHGGRLWLTSQEGHGTVVTFTLPLA
jgi:signal transduction histidine kinase